MGSGAKFGADNTDEDRLGENGVHLNKHQSSDASTYMAENWEHCISKYRSPYLHFSAVKKNEPNIRDKAIG